MDLEPPKPTTEEDGKDQTCGGREFQSEEESGFQLAVQDGILQLDLQDMDALSSLNKELSMMLDVTVRSTTLLIRIVSSPHELYECNVLVGGLMKHLVGRGAELINSTK